MRSILSFAALISIIFSTIGPIFGQNSVKRAQKANERSESKKREPRQGRPLPTPPRRPVKLRDQTRFGKVESFTEGKGVYVKWTMESEQKNAGFRVYRSGKHSDELVSGFIMGSSFTFGDQLLTGAQYHAYDPNGSMDSAYYVEAVNDDGTSLTSPYTATVYTDDVRNIPDGTKIKEETFAPKAGDTRVSEELNVTSELQTEIQSGLIAPDPDRHREVISTPGGVKIASKADGLIRVTKAQLQNGGFDVNSDSTNWQIYMDGVELPMIIGANDDYIEFFGKSLDTVESDIRTYYLIPENAPGRRIPGQTVRQPLTSVVSRKYDQTFIRKDKISYTSQVLNGEAENWWGDLIFSSFVDYKFNLSGIDRTAGTRKVTVQFQGFSLTNHRVELSLNGLSLSDVISSGRTEYQATFDVPVENLLDGQNTLRMRSIGLGFEPSGLPTGGDFTFLEQLSIEFPRKYIAQGNKLEFYTENYKNTQVSGFSSPNIRVFDVTYENFPRVLTNMDIVETNGTFGPLIPAARGQVLYAVEAGVFGSAQSVTPNDPSLLEVPSNTGTMLLIAHPTLMAEANNWAAYRTSQGVVTKVVDVTDIYDEFNFGIMSSQAIEDFLFYAKNNWQTPPSYVLLFGDGHYDSRNYDGLDVGYWNMVPSRLVDTLYEQTGSDEALSDFNDDGLAEIPIGRIPARTGAVVTTALNKTIAWEASLTPNSMDRGVLFAHDWPEGYDFHAMSDRLMSHLPEAVPKTSIAYSVFFNGSKWVLDPTAQPAILAAINELDGGTAQNPGPNAGQYLLNYTGHGNIPAWRDSNFFSATQAQQLTNASYPSLMISLTCLNGYFSADFDGFAEAMLKWNNGGAVAVWASTGKTTPDVQEIMGTRFYTKLGEGNIPRLGDLINDAKAQVPAQADVRLSWALVGDPMLKVR